MKKSILIVLYYYHPYVSGLTVYAKELAENLVKRGYNITVLTTQHEKNLSKNEIINGVHVIRVPVILKVGKGIIAPTLWLKAVLLALKMDIIHFHLPLADAGLSSLFIRRNKIITTYHCDLNMGRGIVNKLLEYVSYFFMNITLYRSSKIVFNSIDYFENSRFMKYASKGIQIYPPINDKEFHTMDFSDLMKKLSLYNDSHKIGFVGRIVAEKGLHQLLDSIKYLKKELRNFIILIAGEYEKVAGGSIKDDLDFFEKKYPGTILFTGFLDHDELLMFYSMIDVLVLPSIDPLESFGMVQVEALWCNTPVIASNMPGVREVISVTGYGYLVEPNDSKDIANKIVKVIQNKPSIEHSKLNCFKLEKTISEYEKIFDA